MAAKRLPRCLRNFIPANRSGMLAAPMNRLVYRSPLLVRLPSARILTGHSPLPVATPVPVPEQFK